MRKKEKWMFNGAIVWALGNKAVIVSMQENNIDGVDYVYYIHCRYEADKHPRNFHPDDVQEMLNVAPCCCGNCSCKK